MSQLFRLGDSGLPAAALLFAFAGMMTACESKVELAMRQPIDMGPWTFEVHGATERVESRGGQQIKIVSVGLKLHDYEERNEKPFDDFLNGHNPGSMMASPNLQLEDPAGAHFDGWLVPSSGGSLRSEVWRAEFLLVPSAGVDSMESTADLAGNYLDSRLSDLRLAIENPEPRRGQSRRVSVKLQ